MKRHEWLQDLSREHHLALRLALAARRAVAADDPTQVRAAAKLCADAFGSDLEPHFIREERDVLPLLGQRLSDAEIAALLFIGVRTAEFHVANIMGKLGATSRREAIASAARMGLL